MSIVYYPAMGLDIVTPVLCVPNLEKIYATAPLDNDKFPKQTLRKTILFIRSLINSGTSEFYAKPYQEIIEFFDVESESQVIKEYTFKRKKMWYMQFKYFNRTITVYLYFTNHCNHDPIPFTEKVDYIIHKDYPFNVEERTSELLKILKPTTKIIANKPDLRMHWKYSRKTMKKKKPIEEYETIVEQTEGEEQSLYCMNDFFKKSQSKTTL